MMQWSAPNHRAPIASMIPDPPSTLLEPGTTRLGLTVQTLQMTECRWDLADVPFHAMNHSFAGLGSTIHTTTLEGLSGTLQVTTVNVRCAASAGKLALAYRCLPNSQVAPFPRQGNLWGNFNFRAHPEGLRYAASRSSLWLGADWSPAEISELRRYNPATVVRRLFLPEARTLYP